MGAEANRGLMLAVAGIALLLAATLIAYRPPTPLGQDASPDVFSAHRAKAILQELVGNGIPHPIGSPDAARLRAAIVDRLSALGYTFELQTGFVCNDDAVCGSPVNIIATRGAVSSDQNLVLLTAHYDSVPAGPGASDDAAGVASMLEIARILAQRPAPRQAIAFLITDGEEAGLLGALLFVHQHPLSKLVKSAVNMDARGTSGLSLMFETGSANTWLMRLYKSAVARPMTNSLYYLVYKLLPNDTDFTVFKKSYQGFNFAFIGNVGRYHTPLDNVANADASTIQHQGDNALAVLWALANAPPPNPAMAESVFFDVFAGGMIAWPIGSTLPASLLALTILLAESGILLKKSAVSVREILWGGLGTLSMLVFGVALCVGLLAATIAVGKVPSLDGASWISHPLPMHLAAAAIAVLAAGVTSVRLGQRAGFWGFWVAVALLGAALSVAAAAFAPGASFVLLLPVIAAGLAALPVAASLAAARAVTPWRRELAAVLPALVIFATVLPLLQFLYTGLGSPAWPVSTLVLSLGMAALLPLLSIASNRMRRGIVLSAVSIAVGGVLVTLCLPTYSRDWPQRVSLEYWWDADTGRPQYLARCESLDLPAALAAAAQFDPLPRPRLPGGGAVAFYAEAPQQPFQPSLAAPDLSLTSQPTAVSRPGGTTTHFQVELRSMRGASEALVIFPAGAKVTEVEWMTAAGAVPVTPSRLRSGATVLDFVALPADGLKFSFDAAGPLPMAVHVIDESYAFPDGLAVLQARPPNATGSQDGDMTVVHRTVSLGPAAGR